MEKRSFCNFYFKMKDNLLISDTELIQFKSHHCLDLMFISLYNSYGPQREKTCLSRYGNNKGGDQPSHPRLLISTFVIRFLERIIS